MIRDRRFPRQRQRLMERTREGRAWSANQRLFKRCGRLIRERHELQKALDAFVSANANVTFSCVPSAQ